MKGFPQAQTEQSETNCLHSEPPEVFFEDGQGAAYFWMADKTGSVHPLEEPGTDRIRHKLAAGWAVTWVKLFLLSLSYYQFDLPGNSFHHTG